MTFRDSNGYTFAEVEVERIAGSRTATAGMLLVWFRFELTGRPERRELFEPAAKMTIGDRLFVARMQPDRAASVRAYAEDRKASLFMECELTSRHVEAIERVRAGGNLSVTFAISGRLEESASRSFGFEEIKFTMAQSDWVKVLADLGYPKMRLLEVPVPDASADPQMKRAYDCLEAGERKVQSGDYRGAVGHCREALEALSDAMGDATAPPPNPVSATNTLKDTETWDKTERIRLVRRAARVFTHPAHHMGLSKGTPPHDYDRIDALSIMSIVAALITQCAPRP